MPVRVNVFLQDTGSEEPAIIDDDGELEFLDYDLETDIIAAELGDEPSSAYWNHKFLSTHIHPQVYLLHHCTWLGNPAWGLVLCHWAEKCLEKSSADEHKALLEPLSVVRDYWDGTIAVSQEDLWLLRKTKISRAASMSRSYNHWWNKTADIAKIALAFPIDAFATPTPELLRIASEGWQNTWMSLYRRRLIEIYGEHDPRPGQAIRDIRIEVLEECALDTISYIEELQESGCAEIPTCHCSKQDLPID